MRFLVLMSLLERGPAVRRILWIRRSPETTLLERGAAVPVLVSFEVLGSPGSKVSTEMGASVELSPALQFCPRTS